MCETCKFTGRHHLQPRHQVVWPTRRSPLEGAKRTLRCDPWKLEDGFILKGFSVVHSAKVNIVPKLDINMLWCTSIYAYIYIQYMLYIFKSAGVSGECFLAFCTAWNVKYLPNVFGVKWKSGISSLSCMTIPLVVDNSVYHVMMQSWSSAFFARFPVIHLTPASWSTTKPQPPQPPLGRWVEFPEPWRNSGHAWLSAASNPWDFCGSGEQP